MSLALWLRAGRAQRQLTLDDVARVTKIQPRILEKIEAGNLEGLPAEVFVRGFVKSFARCVGLNESEAIERYGQCANAPISASTSVARAFVETLVAAPKSDKSGERPARSNAEGGAKVDDKSHAPSAPSVLEAPPPEIFPEASLELAQVEPVAEPDDVEVVIEVVEIPMIEVVEIVAAAEEIPAGGKKKRTRKKAAGTAPPRTRKKKSTVELIDAAPVTVEASVHQLAEAGEASVIDASAAAVEMFGEDDEVVTEAAPSEELVLAEGSEPIVADPWTPKMPAVAATPPWKRPAYPIAKASPFTIPSLVIDDADPDLAEREREDRASATRPGPHRVSFLPAILLDRDDKSSRQGGLTLAVILLLIAATLTLSYLMRRPSVSGDGVTQNAVVDTTTFVA